MHKKIKKLAWWVLLIYFEQKNLTKMRNLNVGQDSEGGAEGYLFKNIFEDF